MKIGIRKKKTVRKKGPVNSCKVENKKSLKKTKNIVPLKNQKSQSKKPSLATRNKQSLKKKRKKRVVVKKRLSFKIVRKGIVELCVALVIAVLFSLVISSFFIKVTGVSGYSMMPTLQDGDTVLVRKTKNVERFDLVLFQRGETQQVRRVIGLPGEQIKYSEDFLYVNGAVVDEKFIIDEINETQKNGGQYTKDFQLYEINENIVIPENSYLVLGDNREYGYDSRDYGLIDSQQIIGVVKMRVLPLNDVSAF